MVAIEDEHHPVRLSGDCGVLSDYRTHHAHFFGLLPYALLLLCPLLHLFMHSGHGGHGNQGDHRQQTAEKPQSWQGKNHERTGSSGLWPVAVSDHQRRRLYHLRL